MRANPIEPPATLAEIDEALTHAVRTRDDLMAHGTAQAAMKASEHVDALLELRLLTALVEP